MAKSQTAEHQRLAASESRQADWKNWGPYLSERAWGTVREDYSASGEAWEFFPHDQARSRAYRWNEDGLGGVSNRFQNICLSVALWNEQDPILKERLFGLTGNEGNHGEDVKEYYFYLDSTPTHSYMKMLYKYPQVAYPYGRLVAENQQRGRDAPEFELIDALYDAFVEHRYFDIFIEYAKAGEADLLCRISAINRGPDPAPIHVLPHLWYRNTWSWGHNPTRPEMQAVNHTTVHTAHRHLKERWWSASAENTTNDIRLLFTENDTNTERLFGTPNEIPYVKDGINDAVVYGLSERVNPDQRGTKVAAHCQTVLEPGETFTVKVRFSDAAHQEPFSDFDTIFQQRMAEADEFYQAVQPPNLSADERLIQRQAFAGLMWTKQFYHYGVQLWLDGDPISALPESRQQGRNADWSHLYNLDVISMPDKWEYPWYAAWDLAFHALPIALIDPEWAKRQLTLMTREWYMHPNGQLPAYEWAFGDVNPPVHAWAAWRVYKITRNVTGHADADFLERIFHKLLLNFTWWVNRKDAAGNNIFHGGFLGLDNIGVFDRSAPLPTGGYIEQADGTAWMGMFCLNMLAIALELAQTRPAYEDVATKFFEHFIYIADAISKMGGGHQGLWDEEDGFFYDMLRLPTGEHVPLKVRSFVGLIPLFAVEIFGPEAYERLPRFRKRVQWFLQYRPNLLKNIPNIAKTGESDRHLLSIVNPEQLARVLERMLDPDQFLSDYGLRALSKEYGANPYTFQLNGQALTVGYEPAESSSGMFGGNSNWRGPIWFPVNYLMIESLQKYHYYFGDSFTVPLSGQQMTLDAVADDLAQRLIRIFQKDEANGGHRPFYGGVDYFQADPHWRDYLLFYEYFHGDNGAGIGASHQTGWTALVAKLIQQCSNRGDES